MLPPALHRLQLLLQRVDPAADMPPIAFQLGFAGAPGADTAAQTGQGGSLPRQPGQQILQLRQLHLQPPLRRPGAGSENVQNQGGAIHHPAGQRVGKIPLLGGGQLPVEDHQIHPRVFADLAQLLQPAAADAGGLVGRLPFLNKPPGHPGPRRTGQLLQLVQGTVHVEFPGVQRHQDRLLRRFVGQRPFTFFQMDAPVLRGCGTVRFRAKKCAGERNHTPGRSVLFDYVRKNAKKYACCGPYSCFSIPFSLCIVHSMNSEISGKFGSKKARPT